MAGTTAVTGQKAIFKDRWIQGFPGNSVVKNLPAIQETKVQSLGQEDPLEKEMATHSSILPWEIPWTVACTKLLHPRDFQGKSTGVGCHFLQGIFPTQGLNPGLSHCRQTLYLLSH